MLKVLQARLQQYMNWEHPDAQSGYKETDESEIKLPAFIGSWRELRNSIKVSASASRTMLKTLTMWVTTNCGKFLKSWEYQTTLPVSWETCMRVKKQQLELDVEKRTGWILGEEYDKAVYCRPAYLTCMQNTSYEMQGWMSHKLESFCWEKCQQPHICR